MQRGLGGTDMSLALTLLHALFIFLVSLPFLLDREHRFSNPAAVSRPRGLVYGAAQYALGEPMLLNRTAMWTYELDHSPGLAEFTALHLVTHHVDKTPFCVESFRTRIKTCDFEVSRRYFLPEATVPEQRSSCYGSSCTSMIHLPPYHYSAITFYHVTSPLGEVVAHQRHAFAGRRAYNLSYYVDPRRRFSWKPVYLRIKTKRIFDAPIPAIDFHHTFTILVGDTIDAIFSPVTE